VDNFLVSQPVGWPSIELVVRRTSLIWSACDAAPVREVIPVKYKRSTARFAVVSMLLLALTSLFAASASATQLPNDLGTIKCKEYKFAPKHKIQACTAVNWANAEHTGIGAGADVTAYVKVKIDGVNQWVVDNDTQVFADTVQLYVNGQTALGQGYPSGPQSGYASTAARGVYELSSGSSYTVFSKGTLSLWQGGTASHTINVQSYSRTVTV
jgi:hypothetical protein